MHPGMRFRAAIAVVSLAVSGCGTATDGISAPVALSSLTPVTSAAQFDLPLMRFFPKVDDLVLIDRGIKALQAECMARFGAGDVVLPASDPASFEAELDVSRRYGLVDRSEVEKYGYGRPPRDGASDDKDGVGLGALGEEIYFDENPASGERSKLTDSDGNPVPEGGCMEDGGVRFLDGNTMEWRTTARMMLENSWGELVLHPVYVAAERDWSVCMKRSGYEFEHVADAGNSVAGDDSQRQLEMALLELRCAEESNFAARALAADQEIQRRLVDENEATLRAALDECAELVKRAKEVLR